MFQNKYLLNDQLQRRIPCILSYLVMKRDSPYPSLCRVLLPVVTRNMEQIIVNNRCHNDLFLSGGMRHRQITRQERLRTGENKSWKYTVKS